MSFASSQEGGSVGRPLSLPAVLLVASTALGAGHIMTPHWTASGRDVL